MLIASDQTRNCFSRCDVEKLKADKVQVIETSQTNEISNLCIDKLLKLTDLVVMTANLFPKIVGNSLKVSKVVSYL